MGRDIDKSRKRNVAKGHLPSRRQLLKGAAAVAGAAAGSSVIGAPVIWAQEIKDIELRHVGVSYSVVKAIGDQAAKDLGFKVTMQNLDTSAAINRFITQPNSVDIADLEGWQAKLAAKRGVIQGIKSRRSRNSTTSCRSSPRANSTATRFRVRASRPMRRCTSRKPNSTDLHDGVTDWVTFLPQVYNADSIGYRPDLVDHRSPNGRTCSIPNSRARPRSSTCRRSASWMRRCASRAPT